jgi:hypothetical protein
MTGEIETLRVAVEELHSPERLGDLLVARLANDHAPPALIEQAQALQAGIHEWLQL